MKRIFLVVAVLMFLAGCQPLENTARDVIAGSQGFIQKAQENHRSECQAAPAKDFPCQIINRAVAAQNLAVDALAIYCGFARDTPPNTPCQANKSAAAILKSALDGLQKTIQDYKDASR